MLFAPSGPQSPRRRSRIKAILLTIFIVIALYLLFFANTKLPVKPETGTYADRHGAATTPKPTDELAHPVIPSQKVMVVASMKKDDTSWLRQNFPDWSKSIYVVDDKHAPLTVAYNKGRESMVYLSYIIDNYNNLPESMLFIHSQRYQWHNDDPYYDGIPPLQHFQVPYLQEQGYVNLRCVWTLGCPTEIHPLTDTHRSAVHAGEYYKTGFMELFPNTPVPEEVGVSCCAQFGVSRAKVLERPRLDYERYRAWLSNTPLPDDLSGRIMEYSWHMIFGMKPVHCPNAKECYCKVFGLCDLNCPWEGGCDDRYALPPYSSLPKGWPKIGWKGQEQDPTHGLPETTGKSTVSTILSTPPYSLPIIDADLLARKVVEPGTAGYKAIVNYFGPSTPDLLLEDASNPSGKPLNRPALGRRVFGSTEERKRDRQVLNGIVHPAVRWEVYKALIYHYLRGQWAVVLDVPLLFESGMDLICGTVIVVGVHDPEIQMARLRARDAHLTAEDAENRVRSQGDVRTKATQAEFRGTATARGVVVWNDADKAELEIAVKRAMTSIAASSPRWWAWALLVAPPVGFGVAAWNLVVNFATKKGWERSKQEEKAKL
ncbi:unnamed protein product [Penicillium olsonii]|uniref:Uncharacterized protein n=1 Tax=Penicillium olsonii TaxID=99116 RepID=A0A9W4ICN9_PENOL|nr:unnamed protein product [Penicillium olsonii]CAG8260655.1 unnamed protein product [Penicillium olsonii]